MTNTTIRIIAAIFTIIAELFTLTLLVWSVLTAQPLVLSVVALSLSSVFVYFLYIDYKYFFDGGKDHVSNNTDDKV